MLCFEGFCEYAKISDPADNTARLCYDAAVQAAKDAGVPGWLFERGHPVLSFSSTRSRCTGMTTAGLRRSSRSRRSTSIANEF